MDIASIPNTQPSQTQVQLICPQCHQPVMEQWYFCPNCGKNLHEPPLDTSIWAQIKLYSFTLIAMPFTCYLVYRGWKGWKYFRSDDPKARTIGMISIFMLGLTFIFLVWSTIASIQWLEYQVQQENQQMNGLGNLEGL